MKLFNDGTMYGKKLSNIGLIWQTIKPVLIYLIIYIIITIILFSYSVSIDNMDVNALDYAEKFNIKYGMLLNISIQLISIFFLYLIYRKDKRKYPKSEKNNVLTILYGGLLILCIGIISSYIIDLLIHLFPSLVEEYQDIENMIINSNFTLAFITTCILAPIMEEIMFRGLILNNLLSKKSIWFSVIISSLIFGIIHFNLVQGINAFILGIFLAITYIKTRNLWVCILGHFLNNLISVVCLTINLSNLTYNIINIIIVILCIYPSIKFFKEKNVKITSFDSV